MDAVAGVFDRVCALAAPADSAQPVPSPRIIDSAVLSLRGLPLMHTGRATTQLAQAHELAENSSAAEAFHAAIARIAALSSASEAELQATGKKQSFKVSEPAVLAIIDVANTLLQLGQEEESVAQEVASQWLTAGCARQLAQLVVADGRHWSTIAEASKKLLVKMAVTETTEAVLLSDAPLWATIGVCASSGAVTGSRLRSFELAVACVLAIPAAAGTHAAGSVLSQLMELTIELLQGAIGRTGGSTVADPLAALAVLEIDTKLARSTEGLNLMLETQVLQEARAATDAILQGTADQFASRFLRNPLLSFFADVAAACPATDANVFIDIDCWFIPTLLCGFEQLSDEVSLTIMSEAVCKIASTISGLRSLARDTRDTRSLRSEFQCIASSSTNARVGWLHMVGNLLDVWGNRLQRSHGFSGASDTEIEDFLGLLCRSPVPEGDLFADAVWPLFRDPFRERRFAALHMTQGLCALPTTARDVISRPGFFEYLTDRTTEAHPRDLSFESSSSGTRPRGKDGLEWKFAVVQQALQTHEASVKAHGPSGAVIPEHILPGLIEYHSRGPFWMTIREDAPVVSTETG